MNNYINRLKNNDPNLIKLDINSMDISQVEIIAISRVCFSLSLIK